MAKKAKRDRHEPETGATYDPPANTEAELPTYQEMRGILKERIPDMASVRAEALKQQNDVAHIVAELEAWRAEIDATIAFLRAKR